MVRFHNFVKYFQNSRFFLIVALKGDLNYFWMGIIMVLSRIINHRYHLKSMVAVLMIDVICILDLVPSTNFLQCLYLWMME